MEEFSRAIRTGNTFLLLSPTQVQTELDAHVQRLQQILGGRRIDPLHFTSQRFTFQDEAGWSGFCQELGERLSEVPPLVFHATGLVPLYSEYRQARVLKWRILPNEELVEFSRMIETMLTRHGGRSFFPRGWHTKLITALEHVDRVDLSLRHEEQRIPWPLFTTERIILSRFTSQDDYETLEEFPLSKER